MQSKYKRVLLKVSGEVLAGEKGTGIDDAMLLSVAGDVKKLRDLGVEIALVVGGGNFWRGRTSEGMDRAQADYMGMLATCINALGLEDAFRRLGIPCVVQTSLDMHTIAEPYNRRSACQALGEGKVVIFAAGTGSPFVSTDTCASLRAAEMGCEVILLAKKVDAVYDSDPEKNPNAKKFKTLTHQQVLELGLQVMDATAAAMCRDNNIKIHCFGLKEPDGILRAVCGEDLGTIIS